jgi:hypothetical protein
MIVLVVAPYSRSTNGEVKTHKMSSRKTVIVSGAVAAIVAIALVAAAMFTPGLVTKPTTTTSSTMSTSLSGSSSTSSGSGTVGATLTDPPTVPPGVTDVYVNYSEIAVHVADAGNETGWYEIAPAGEIDLMSVINTSITLGSAQVTSGVYNAIGFNITSATVTANGVNQTAYLTSNHLFAPIVGDLQVSAGSNQGVLVDLSPTVVAVENGSATAYVLVPAAHILRIPLSVWIAENHQGYRDNNLGKESWYQQARGDIAITSESLSANSLSVTIMNKGQNASVVSWISIYYPLDVICQQYTNACMASPSFGINMPRAIPVALFAVSSSGNLAQYNFTASAIARSTGNSGVFQMSGPLNFSSGAQVGYILSPGQSVTLTFNGPISTIKENILDYLHMNVGVPQSLMNAITTINSGQQYYIIASGPCFTFAYQLVTAGGSSSSSSTSTTTTLSTSSETSTSSSSS